MDKKSNSKPNKADADRCVCCGAIIPEGQQVCYFCMMKAGKEEARKVE